MSCVGCIYHCRLIGDVDSCYCFVKTPPLSALTENKPKTYLVANHTLVLPEYIVTIEYKVLMIDVASCYHDIFRKRSKMSGHVIIQMLDHMI